MLLVLFALFFRPVGFDYRSKIANKTWRNSWDWLHFVGRLVPPVSAASPSVTCSKVYRSTSTII